MNTQTKLQVCAGIGAVISLPIIYFGLRSGGAVLSWFGTALFVVSMPVTPVLRVLAASVYEDRNDVERSWHRPKAPNMPAATCARA